MKSTSKHDGAKNAAKAAAEIKIYKPKEDASRAYGYPHANEPEGSDRSKAQSAHDGRMKK